MPSSSSMSLASRPNSATREAAAPSTQMGNDGRPRYDRSVSSQADVSRILGKLPEVTRDTRWFHFRVAGKQFAWVYPERVDPKARRVPNPDVLVMWTGDELEKEALIALDSGTFFTTEHYNGYPAVLVRLSRIPVERLEELLTDAWRKRAPKRVVSAWESTEERR